METPAQKMLRLLVERAPTGVEFQDDVQAVLHSELRTEALPGNYFSGNAEFVWADVFVQQELPWGRFLESTLLHTAAVVLIWTLSIAWLRQQKILDRPVFDRSSLITYTPEEYLPPLDTGASEAPPEKGDPVYAKQPILSVPPEADNRSQTIVVPPDLKLNQDVPLPNIVATGAIAPTVPLDATRSALNRIAVPDAQVIAPAPDVQFTPVRVVRTAMNSSVIAPPPEVTAHPTRGLTGPETAVVEPPPEITPSPKGRVGGMNIGPSEAVAPAPQLAVAEQHSVAGRGRGPLPGGGMQPVGPPPSVTATGGSSASGRLIALGIHPVVPSGPVAAPAGNRRGTFSATPQGKPGASGTPDLAGSKSDAKGAGVRSNNGRGSLPAGLHVGGADSNANTGANSGSDNPRETASLPSSGAAPGARVAAAVPDDKITDVDRKVFGGKRVYGRTLNMPNLNSSTGSWIIKFAELNEGQKSEGRKQGDLLEPVATEKSDPGYPLELIRANVHGMVTLYAVIHADGKVGDIRVLNSPDERLDAYAAKALARWKFVPAERAGKPVALEAVVEIPFRVRRNF